MAPVVAIAPLAHASPVFYFAADAPYLSFNDSPFESVLAAGDFSYWVFKDFQDNSLDFGPGVSFTPGYTIYADGLGSLADSVEFTGDPPTGHSLFGGGLFYLDFATGPGLLDNLPTHVGMVWTDGQAPAITFEAFDRHGVSLGSVTGHHADGSITGTTDEDRFYGVFFADGIARVTLSSSGAYQEIDHIQFGHAIPEPAAALLLAAGVLGLVLARRRRRRP
jgi:hypothetical protein